MRKQGMIKELESKFEQALRKETSLMTKAGETNRDLNQAVAEREFIGYQLLCAKQGREIPQKPDPFDQREHYTEADDVSGYEEFAMSTVRKYH